MNAKDLTGAAQLALGALFEFGAWLQDHMAFFVCCVTVTVALIAAAARLFRKDAGGFTVRGLSLRLKRKASGIVLGSFFGLAVISPESKEGHVACVGSSGSGKTQDCYTPTLRYWKGHWLAFDAAADIAATLRREDLIVFAPDNSDNAISYNVFFAADRAPDWEGQKAELRNIAIALIPDSAAEGETAAYFAGNARQVLTAVLWSSYKAEKDFGNVMGDLSTKNTLEEVLEAIEGGGCAEAWQLVGGLYGQNDKNLAGVFGELRNAISLFATSKRVCEKLNRTGVSPATLESKSVLLAFPPGRFAYFSPLCRLIYEQAVSHCLSRPVGATPRILLAVDELPKFGGIDVLTPLEQARKFGVRLLLAFQSVADIRRIYGMDEAAAILENLQIKVVTECIGTDSQEYFSKLAGEVKIKDRRKTARISADGTTVAPTSETTGERWEPLIRPEELGRLRHKDQKLLVFHHGEVAKIRKWPAYRDRGYLRRARKSEKKRKMWEKFEKKQRKIDSIGGAYERAAAMRSKTGAAHVLCGYTDADEKRHFFEGVPVKERAFKRLAKAAMAAGVIIHAVHK